MDADVLRESKAGGCSLPFGAGAREGREGGGQIFSSWMVISICQCQDVGDPQARGTAVFVQF